MDVMSNLNTDSVSVSGAPKALVKGIALIDLVADGAGGIRQTELIERSGLPRATAIRLLDALCDLNVLQVDRRGGYGLGPRLAGWGQKFINSLDVTQVGSDLIEDLVAETRETCFVGVLDGASVLYIVAEHSPQPVRPAARVGFRNPLYCTGIGKVLLAFADQDDQRRLIEETTFSARTENTITDAEMLRAQLRTIVERGYATDDIENEEGVRCVAAPIRDHHGDVVAALSVSAPAYRFSHEHVVDLAPRVRSTADQLSLRLGYAGAASLPNREELPHGTG